MDIVTVPFLQRVFSKHLSPVTNNIETLSVCGTKCDGSLFIIYHYIYHQKGKKTNQQQQLQNPENLKCESNVVEKCIEELVVSSYILTVFLPAFIC